MESINSDLEIKKKYLKDEIENSRKRNKKIFEKIILFFIIGFAYSITIVSFQKYNSKIPLLFLLFGAFFIIKIYFDNKKMESKLFSELIFLNRGTFPIEGNNNFETTSTSEKDKKLDNILFNYKEIIVGITLFNIIIVGGGTLFGVLEMKSIATRGENIKKQLFTIQDELKEETLKIKSIFEKKVELLEIEIEKDGINATNQINKEQKRYSDSLELKYKEVIKTLDTNKSELETYEQNINTLNIRKISLEKKIKRLENLDRLNNILDKIEKYASINTLIYLLIVCVPLNIVIIIFWIKQHFKKKR
ncbi:MAG: hypothetical protein WBG30_15405 [Psychrilyobacter sp.]|uniref:hypothetical protein n=1 Tax=Psychrilyobacter sp. TaxID=2586924 RepID=UPI003C713D3C